MPRTPIRPKTAGTIYLALGAVVLVAALALAIWPQALSTSARIGEGTVVALRQEPNAQAPTIEFGEPGGAVVRWTGEARGTYAIGQHVHMLYVPDQPGAIAVAGFWATYLAAIAATLLGILFATFGILGRKAAS